MKSLGCKVQALLRRFLACLILALARTHCPLVTMSQIRHGQILQLHDDYRTVFEGRQNGRRAFMRFFATIRLMTFLSWLWGLGERWLRVKEKPLEWESKCTLSPVFVSQRLRHNSLDGSCQTVCLILISFNAEMTCLKNYILQHIPVITRECWIKHCHDLSRFR